MKYVIVLSDGMAGRQLWELGGKTTLQAAATPVMDALAPVSELGIWFRRGWRRGATPRIWR